MEEDGKMTFPDDKDLYDDEFNEDLYSEEEE